MGWWLQPTIDRPFAVEFEDDGGILPAHSVGIGLDGRLSFARADLTYDRGVANGRPRHPDEVADLDDNSEKALYGRWGVRAAQLPLTVGASVYWDQIPTDPERGRTHELDALIAGAHVVCTTGRRGSCSRSIFTCTTGSRRIRTRRRTPGTWTAARVGRWKPYALREGENVDANDPYYETTGGHRRRYTFGLEVEVLPMAIVEIEYLRLDETGVPDTNQLAMQAAVAF